MDYPFVAFRYGGAALAASGFVCYNAGQRQFNKNEPWLADS
jgi:hypothetical protein